MACFKNIKIQKNKKKQKKYLDKGTKNAKEENKRLK
jgi:hypothetical protein